MTQTDITLQGLDRRAPFPVEVDGRVMRVTPAIMHRLVVRAFGRPLSDWLSWMDLHCLAKLAGGLFDATCLKADPPENDRVGELLDHWGISLGKRRPKRPATAEQFHTLIEVVFSDQYPLGEKGLALVLLEGALPNSIFHHPEEAVRQQKADPWHFGPEGPTSVTFN
jgi:hypothetical protein